MRTKKRRDTSARETFTVGPSEPETQPETETVSESRPARERFQLSFDLNEDGTPDLSTMRGRTKERVQQFFSDPRMASAFGAKAPVAPEVQLFNPMMVTGMYSVLGSLETMLAIRMGNIPEPIARRAFTYTPEEIQALTGPTVRVLNKYAADWMIKYQDEIALGTMLVGMTINKVNTALMLTKLQGTTITQEPSQEKNDETPKNGGVVQ